MSNPTPVEAQLQRLRERFVAALPLRIEALESAIDACAGNPATAENLTRLFHSLAGTAGTYGLGTVAALAREGEAICDSAATDDESLGYLRSLVESIRYAETEQVPVAAEPPLVQSEPPAEGRILCVEDDSDQARFIHTILEAAGYQVRLVSDPEEFPLQVLLFRPELILMDIVLPGVSGVDLARTVRNDPASATVPIVFLTNRTRDESRIAAASAGGDDYLVKPVAPELLRSIVAARLKTSRAMQQLIDRDGLTGLLTHAAFMRRAEKELLHAMRNESEVALVMLDLDYFKSINDAHGHITGDHVLTAFASFLRTSIRGGDDAGRYGGEEFAILLRDISIEDVQRFVTRLIDEFSRVVFRGARGSSFHVTFSAGIAILEDGWDLCDWTQHADDALYSAKNLGRARVEAA